MCSCPIETEEQREFNANKFVRAMFLNAIHFIALAQFQSAKFESRNTFFFSRIVYNQLYKHTSIQPFLCARFIVDLAKLAIRKRWTVEQTDTSISICPLIIVVQLHRYKAILSLATCYLFINTFIKIFFLHSNFGIWNDIYGMVMMTTTMIMSNWRGNKWNEKHALN